jgi:peptidoglycan/LPS O-acetylase OafA/YrhL
MVAPLIARRSLPVIVALLVASLALRMGLQFGFGFKDDPWSYRFFPSEFALFLTGILGYHAYRERNARGKTMWIFVISTACVGICLLINRWNGIGRVASITCLVVAIILIPTLFRRTHRNRIDRYLGELSYPIYVVHLLASWLVLELTTGWPPGWQAAAVMIGTVVSAAVLYALIAEPIERLRQRRAVALATWATRAVPRQPS